MNLTNFEEGQEFKYILLEGFDYRGETDQFSYTGDTLILKVLETLNDSVLISERITEHSSMKKTTNHPYTNFHSWPEMKDQVFTNYWIIRNDSLIFEGSEGKAFSSHLITDIWWLRNGRNLSLKVFAGQQVEITGWKTSYQYPYTEPSQVELELFAINYELFNKNYDHLNILIDNAALAGDASGKTTVYSKQHGIVKTSNYFTFPHIGIGWDRLE